MEQFHVLFIVDKKDDVDQADKVENRKTEEKDENSGKLVTVARKQPEVISSSVCCRC